MEKIEKAYNTVIRRLEEMGFLIEKKFRFVGKIPGQENYGAVFLYNPPYVKKVKTEDLEEFISGLFTDDNENINLIVNSYDSKQVNKDKSKGDYRRIRIISKQGTPQEQKNSLESALWTIVENLGEYEKTFHS
jgi:hypothetical protein